MSIVSAIIIPGSPLPYVRSDNPPWGRLAEAMSCAGESLAKTQPDTIVVYSTSWMAVLDQLWQTRPHLKGIHVDENWHEYGDLPFDINIDTELAIGAVESANAAGIKSKSVNYDQFPIDTGTIVASNFLNPEGNYPLMIASNNLYHDWDLTEQLGQIVRNVSNEQSKRVTVVGIGKLSGSFFRHQIDEAQDKIVSEEDDDWNKKMLNLISDGEMEKFFELCPEYAKEAKVEMGFKHMAFIKGALGDQLTGGKVHAYGPVYGAGAAVIEFPG